MSDIEKNNVEDDINLILESIISGEELDNSDNLLETINNSNQNFSNINMQLENIIDKYSSVGDIAFGYIANALKSSAADHILGIAEDIYDTNLKKYQSEINSSILSSSDALNTYLPLAGGTMTGTINSNHIFPAATNTYNLGRNHVLQYRNVYSKEFTEDGVSLAAKYAPIAHNHDNVYKPLQTPVADPANDDRPHTVFISSITQDANGVISAAKKTVPTLAGATASNDGLSGLVPAPTIRDTASFLKGDGTWSEIPIYTGANATNSTIGTPGLVPRCTPVRAEAFLRGDGTWTQPRTMTGASSSTTGISGFVPAPAVGKQSSFLRGDGTWSEIPTYIGANMATTTDGIPGLVPECLSILSNAFLRGDGVWTQPRTMTGATSSNIGASGFVPAPAAGDQASFLRGDGTWREIPIYTGANMATTTNGIPGLVPECPAGRAEAFLRGDGHWITPVDTKNTAGSTDSSSKLYLIGATSQAANPQTYSHDTAYVDTDGCLYSNSSRTLTIHEWTCEFQQIYTGSVTLHDYSVDIKSSKQDTPNVGDIIKVSFMYSSNLNGVVDPKLTIALSRNFNIIYSNNSTGTLSITNYDNIYIRNIYPSNGVIYLRVLKIVSSIIYAHMIYNSYIGTISDYAKTADISDISNKTDVYQFYDYGNLYTGGASSDTPKLPTSLQLSGDVKFVDGGRLIVKFYNNYGKELELENALGLSDIIFPDGTSIPLTYDAMKSTGYQKTHMGDHFLDIIMNLNGGSEYGYLIGYSAPIADYAASVNIFTSSSSSSYPLVFTNNLAAEIKPLYTDTANSLYYNPSSNTLTVPTASITTAKASTIANKTSGSTIAFDDCIKIKTSSHVQGLMNFKGSDHNNDVLYVSGGSTTSAPSIVIKTKNNKDYVGISMVGKADTTSAAEIKVYGTSTSSYTTIQGGKNAAVTSDERLKDFGDNIEVDFNELKQIPKKYFTWKNDDIKVSNIGTSAQSIEKLYPELVITDDNGYKSLDYSTLSIIALAAIDKLNERIEYLENKLKEYEQ